MGGQGSWGIVGHFGSGTLARSRENDDSSQNIIKQELTVYQKMKVPRIAQPGRQNVNWTCPSILQLLINPLLPYIWYIYNIYIYGIWYMVYGIWYMVYGINRLGRLVSVV